MGLLSRRRRTTRTGSPVRASGQRIDLDSRAQLAQLAATRERWQGYAWGYRDAIGEVRFGEEFVARNVGKVVLRAAVVNPEEDEPTPIPGAEPEDLHGVDMRLAADAVEELDRLPRGYSFLGRIAANFEIAGECWLHGFMQRDDEDDEDEGVETWKVRSVDEVVSDGGGWAIRTYGSAVPRPVRQDEELIRLWVQHPRWSNLADSPMRSLLDACEDLMLAGRELRTAARSRIAANGILKVSSGLLLASGTVAGDGPGNPFVRELTEAIVAPISDEQDAGAAAPVVLIGEPEDLAATEHIPIAREDSEQLLEKATAALRRIAQGMDIPPEVITGMSDANHWSAWQIDASTYKNHLDPVVRLVVQALVEGFLRPALRERGYTAEQVRQITIFADASAITENPNRREDAIAVFDRGGLSFARFLSELGFSADDLPDDADLLRMLVAKTGMTPDMVANLLQVAGTVQGQRAQVTPERPADEGRALPGSADQATPETQPKAESAPIVSALLAAATRLDSEWTVDTVTGRDIADIQADLRARILPTLDAALERALERAGAKLRTQARKTADTRARYATQLTDMSAPDFLRSLNADEKLALGLNELDIVDEAIKAVGAKIRDWTVRAIRAVFALTRERFGRAPDTDVERYVADAWDAMADALRTYATRYLQADHPNRQPGEVTDHITPVGAVRDYWASTHTDRRVRDAATEAGAVELGFQWRYGVTPRMDRYEPHHALNGQRFTSPTDERLRTPPSQAWVGTHYRPGDHEGCACDAVPVWAIPATDDQLRERMAETPTQRARRELAEADIAAGRTNTAAVRRQQLRDEVEQLQRTWVEGP